ncbi:unnamed protein product [Ceratitis capitata]|uniref:(Mediterranean fruit fly) hypothetical protein n=1 Tax=Ceratitis capitata TaxID=7213 RepID=A0A811UZS4_CERCA|nr:unnamed protein product [Ceratitis capitata]
MVANNIGLTGRHIRAPSQTKVVDCMWRGMAASTKYLFIPLSDCICEYISVCVGKCVNGLLTFSFYALESSSGQVEEISVVCSEAKLLRRAFKDFKTQTR